MTYKNLELEYPKDGITSKIIYKGENSQTTLFNMAKGTDIEDHTSTKEGYVFVIEGDGIFRLEGEEIEMKPNVMIHMKPNAIHSLKANENTSFILFLSD